jgi:hypothetical protein
MRTTEGRTLVTENRRVWCRCNSLDSSGTVLGCSAHLEETVPVDGSAATHVGLGQVVDDIDAKGVVLARCEMKPGQHSQ